MEWLLWRGQGNRQAVGCVLTPQEAHQTSLPENRQGHTCLFINLSMALGIELSST